MNDIQPSFISSTHGNGYVYTRKMFRAEDDKLLKKEIAICFDTSVGEIRVSMDEAVNLVHQLIQVITRDERHAEYMREAEEGENTEKD